MEHKNAGDKRVLCNQVSCVERESCVGIRHKQSISAPGEKIEETIQQQQKGRLQQYQYQTTSRTPNHKVFVAEPLGLNVRRPIDWCYQVISHSAAVP